MLRCIISTLPSNYIPSFIKLDYILFEILQDPFVPLFHVVNDSVILMISCVKCLCYQLSNRTCRLIKPSLHLNTFIQFQISV